MGPLGQEQFKEQEVDPLGQKQLRGHEMVLLVGKKFQKHLRIKLVGPLGEEKTSEIFEDQVGRSSK